MKYIIGTRGSLLALTQCNQVKDQLEKLTGDEFELKVIKTQGDQIVDKPLWQLEGKDFFTKELDAALLKGEIDLVVHSYKDLGSDRPEGIKLAAITKRDYAHDILFIKEETVSKLMCEELTEFVVGTSSPRRITNIESSLAEYLPYGDKVKVSTKMLRGNVNSRLQKLKDDQYDAIVLAMPGIERLAITESSRKELEVLLSGMTYAVLPHSQFPAAASQGALGIECLEGRDDNGALEEKLLKMQDKDTVSEVSRERQAFASYGGGCHLAVGINVTKKGDYYVHTHKGKVDDKVIFERHLEGSFPSPASKEKAFIGIPHADHREQEYIYCELIQKEALKNARIPNNDVLLAARYGVNLLKNHGKAVYTAGTSTWKLLAQNGQWVHGSADGLGEAYLDKIRDSLAIQVMNGPKEELTILTHKDSYSDYGQVFESYEKSNKEVREAFMQELEQCDVFFWTSYSQYKTYVDHLPAIKDKFHACGLGKTYEQLQKEDITVRPFASMEEFKTWLKN